MTDARTELERKIIAGCIADTTFLPSLQYWLLSDETRRRLVEIIQAIHKRGEPIEPSYLALESAKYDKDLEQIILNEWRYVQETELPQDTETLLVGLINNNIDIICDKIISRLTIAKSKTGATVNDIIEVIEGENNKLFEILPKRIITTISSDIDNAARTFFSVSDRLVNTGIGKLDKELGGGFRKGEVTAIAARPGNLKTGLSVEIAKNIALSKRKCIIFSLEMSIEAVLHKVISSIAGVAQTFPFNDECKSRVNYATNALRDISDKFILYDNVYTVGEVLNIIQKQKPVIAIIDYLQQFRFSVEENMRFDIMRIMKALKRFAKETNIPIVVVSQLSRASEKRINPVPRMSDLAESSAIEWFAADIFAIHYPVNTEVAVDGFSLRNKLNVFALKKRYSSVFATELYIIPEVGTILSDEQSMLEWRQKCPQATKVNIGDLISQAEN